VFVEKYANPAFQNRKAYGLFRKLLHPRKFRKEGKVLFIEEGEVH
jgi:hypothetical protein